jgi:hypothetical protein
MDEADAALAAIIADCASDDDLQRYIMKHAGRLNANEADRPHVSNAPSGKEPAHGL